MRLHRVPRDCTVLALILILPTGGLSQEVEQIELSFAWPAGMSAYVEGVRTKVQVQEGSADSTSLSFSYQLDVREADAGLLVDCSNFQVAGMPSASDVENLAGKVGTLAPDYLVSLEGELQSIAGLEQLVEETRAMVTDSVDSPELRSFMDQVLSEEILMAQLATEWNALVGNWAGATFELGAAYEYETEEPIPLLANTPVLYHYQVGAAARVPCSESDTDSLCVELIQRSRPDPVAMKAALEAFVSRLAEGALPSEIPAFEYKDLSIEFEIVVVTEPSSLIPHALSIYQRFDLTAEADGEEQTRSDTRFRAYRYVYQTSAGS